MTPAERDLAVLLAMLREGTRPGPTALARLLTRHARLLDPPRPDVEPPAPVDLDATH